MSEIMAWPHREFNDLMSREMSDASPFQLYNWHLEISSKCALRCPRCTRTEMPGTFPVTELDLAFIQRLFTPEFLRSTVKRITFSGGVGDPLYNSQLLEIVRYLKSTHPHFQLVLVTNGSYKTREWWRELGQSLNGNDEVIFSVDGWDEASNNLYRKNSNWASIMAGMEEIVLSPAVVRWSTIVFRFNEEHLNQIEQLAESKGVDHFHSVLSERFGRHYIDPELGYDPLEPSTGFKSSIPRTQRFKTVFKRNRDKLALARNIDRQIGAAFKESYERTLQEFSDSHILPTCKFGYRGLYVDVEGRLFPCSWVSHPFNSMQSRVDPKRVLHYADSLLPRAARLSLKERSLTEVLADPMWQELREGWSKASSCYIVCERKCLQSHATHPHLVSKDRATLNASL